MKNLLEQLGQNGGLLKLIRELGALAILGGMTYFLLTNLTSAIQKQGEVMSEAIGKNTAAISEMNKTVGILNTLLGVKPQAGSINSPFDGIRP